MKLLYARARVVKSTPEFTALVDDYDDAAPSMTITNAADEVVEELYRAGLAEPGVRIVYRDTEGRWDELAHDGRGHLTDFVMLNGSSMEDALQRAGIEEKVE